ncbi:MAG: single-stranded-DNA-specific exonuclease RecJ, partial [Kiritimatiellaceae bacterium]|nr:single-stranded-DNA-specific exonuclease RecJ [Kiritimatiellaceae bacterium]
MSKAWKFKSCDEALAEKLFQTLGNLPKPLATLLAQRGCKTEEEACAFMNPALSMLQNPFDLPDMQPAVERIRRALLDGERITVFGDYDADGICSTSLMVRVLRELGGSVSSYIPNRLEDGYGLSPESLAVCVEANHPTLIVTVDCGTSSVEAIEAAKTQGIDVVITDHHEPGGQVANAVAVVNPKRVENHPASILAGVGVAFKLCHALIKVGRDAGCPVSASVDLKNYLDFVAVATVTDMVPLCGENRTLVRAGLQSLEHSIWPGWNALKKLAGINGPIETWHAGFTFGPRINAAGRVGRADAALELFLTDLPERADELAQLLDSANRERQEIEKGIIKEAIDDIDGYFDENKDFGLVIANDGWHAGVIGIVASRLVKRYGRPVAVVGLDGESGRGSCRSIDGFSVLDGLNACSDLLMRFGGHDMAAGLEVRTEHIAEFKKRFNAFATERFKDADLGPVLQIDRAVDLSEVNTELMAGLRRIGPFGQDNPEPVWALLNVGAENAKIL